MKLADSVFKLGTENAFVVLAKAKALEAQGKEIINLGIGQPDFRTPKHIVDAAKKALDDGFHGYTPANGLLELRQGVSRHIKKMYGRKCRCFKSSNYARWKTYNVFRNVNVWSARYRNYLSRTRISNL